MSTLLVRCSRVGCTMFYFSTGFDERSADAALAWAKNHEAWHAEEILAQWAEEREAEQSGE